jgi:hypothetical protein
MFGILSLSDSFTPSWSYNGEDSKHQVGERRLTLRQSTLLQAMPSPGALFCQGMSPVILLTNFPSHAESFQWNIVGSDSLHWSSRPAPITDVALGDALTHCSELPKVPFYSSRGLSPGHTSWADLIDQGSPVGRPGVRLVLDNARVNFFAQTAPLVDPSLVGLPILSPEEDLGVLGSKYRDNKND